MKDNFSSATIVQFSGGLDSTYIAHKLISGRIECDLDNLYFIYVKSNNIDSTQQEEEIKYAKKSLEYLGNR